MSAWAVRAWGASRRRAHQKRAGRHGGLHVFRKTIIPPSRPPVTTNNGRARRRRPTRAIKSPDQLPPFPQKPPSFHATRHGGPLRTRTTSGPQAAGKVRTAPGSGAVCGRRRERETAAVGAPRPGPVPPAGPDQHGPPLPGARVSRWLPPALRAGDRPAAFASWRPAGSPATAGRVAPPGGWASFSLGVHHGRFCLRPLCLLWPALLLGHSGRATALPVLLAGALPGPRQQGPVAGGPVPTTATARAAQV